MAISGFDRHQLAGSSGAVVRVAVAEQHFAEMLGSEHSGAKLKQKARASH